MDDLIIRFLQGRATSDEVARLAGWRRTSNSNERHFQDIAAVWRATAPAEPRAPSPSATEIIERSRGGRRTGRLIALAAMLLLGFALGELRPGGDAGPTLGVGEFITGSTEMATARLSDGTVVRLAPRSRLRVADQTGEREVWLDGKAFFSVAASERHPFLVRTRAGDAHVLGTRFQVEVREDDFHVAVVEGRVDIGANREERISLAAGQVARTSPGAEPIVADHPNVTGLLSWMGAFLAFESTPLERVAEELERRFDIEVRIADPALRDRTVTAWFGEQDLDAVLAVVCRIADTHCSLRNGVAIIEP